MPRTYADNSYNRSLGRVGMAHGTAVVSRSSGGSSSSYGGSGGSYGGTSRSYGSSGSYGSSSTPGYSGSTSSTRTYVDNAHNRSLGRVGMAHGTAVESRSGSGGSYGSSTTSGYSGSTSSTRTYVDNAHNRSLGRVGMPHGIAVESRSGSSYGSYGSTGSSGSTKTYVDNAYNRSIGRVGMEHGTAVVSGSGASSSHGRTEASVNSPSPKTYVDNPQNRKLGRVGKEYGTAVDSKSGNSERSNVYVDNAMNRRLGRVGKPKGSLPHSKSSSEDSPAEKCYVDNPMNRALGRVGKRRGTMPVSRKKSKETKALRDKYQKMNAQRYNPVDEWMGEDWMDDECIMDFINRQDQERMWRHQNERTGHPQTNPKLTQRYEGRVIPYEELDIQTKIGHGGFGDVHYAEWEGSVVAVKKLRVQRVSKKRLKEFTDELMVFCTLEHPNIVKFIGACIVTPNLAIVMEYMQGCLHHALHVSDSHDFSEDDRLSMIKQIIRGLEYLHGRHIAHCDLKTKNVLLNIEDGRPIVKLTDFGLSMMRAESESSSSAAECVSNVGTPRYSAPEVLRGELLNRSAMMQADMYSVSLIMFEIVYEDEPFPAMNYAQLCNHVGNGTSTPDIPDDIHVHDTFKRVLEECWSRTADSRPSAERVVATIDSLPYLVEK